MRRMSDLAEPGPVMLPRPAGVTVPRSMACSEPFTQIAA